MRMMEKRKDNDNRRTKRGNTEGERKKLDIKTGRVETEKEEEEEKYDTKTLGQREEGKRKT